VVSPGEIVCVRRWEGDRWKHYLLKVDDDVWMDPWSKSADKRADVPPFRSAPAVFRKKWPKGWVPLSFISPDHG
jgi:hypothetical protein